MHEQSPWMTYLHFLAAAALLFAAMPISPAVALCAYSHRTAGAALPEDAPIGATVPDEGADGCISGTVFESNGTTPVTDAVISILVYSDDSCDDRRLVAATMTSIGTYALGGLPNGNYYVQAYRESGSAYQVEWYGDTANGGCEGAEPVQVRAGSETGGIDFQLDIGASISGRLVDEGGMPLGNVNVIYKGRELWDQTWSDPEAGAFSFQGLEPGCAEIEIRSHPGRYLAGFKRWYYLKIENRNLGTLEVRKGAVIHGSVIGDGMPLSGFPLAAAAKLVLDDQETDAEGNYTFVLPAGEFTINCDEPSDWYATAPQQVVVEDGDLLSSMSVPQMVAYDLSNGDVYSGTVTVDDKPSGGSAVLAVAFMDDPEFDLNHWSAVNPVSIGGFFDGSSVLNPYRLVTPFGSRVRLGIYLFKEFEDENVSITRIDSAESVSGGGVYDFVYTASGSTVAGLVVRQGEPLFRAMAGLYRRPGNEFAAFAQTDHNGYYVFYDIPNGTFAVQATAQDDDAIVQTADFVVGKDLTVPDITLPANAAPVATVFGAPPGLTNQTGATLTVGGTGVTHYRCKLDAGVYAAEAPVAAPIVLSGLSDGPHIVHVIGRDSAGTWQTWATTASWTVDATPPTATISGVPPSPSPSTSATLTIGGEGVTHYKHMLDNGTYGSENHVNQPIALSGLSDGPHTLHARGRDLAGNWQTSPTVASWTVRSTLTIVASAGVEGSIVPSGRVTVSYGADQDFSIRPEPGYQLADVIVDGVAVWPAAGYSFTNVTADHTIEATFSAATADTSYIEPGGVCGGKAPCFSAIGAGIEADTVATKAHVADGSYAEGIDLDAAKLVIFEGGWDDGFTARTGFTSARGLTIRRGKIIVFRLALGP